MLNHAIDIAFGLLGLAVVFTLVRLVLGPDMLDRVLALDTLYVNSAAMLVLYGLQLGTGRYYEAALLIAMLGFITTVVLSKYITRGDVIE
jgi:multicomponent K+:H+ antiporter subunit F